MDDNALVLADRYNNFMTFPSYNWGYQSAPQKLLNGRQIDYSRGRGLGGSSRINFACYTVGPKGDYDHWANTVGDEFFNWENSKRRYKMIESYEMNIPPEVQRYVAPKPEDHGNSGPVPVSYPAEYEIGLAKFIDAAHESGAKINLDANSGDPIGITMCPSTGSKGMRTTSAAAYLKNSPSNLTIISDSIATKIIIEGGRAIGLVAGGKKCQYIVQCPIQNLGLTDIQLWHRTR
jgi:choline dehydrogenase-like flavoprotein